MQQNWYVVYTKPHLEKKVSLSLTKKNIENFLPLNHKKSRQLFLNKTSGEPIFDRFVFVKSTETEILHAIKEINGALSVLYWKGKTGHY